MGGGAPLNSRREFESWDCPGEILKREEPGAPPPGWPRLVLEDSRPFPGRGPRLGLGSYWTPRTSTCAAAAASHLAMVLLPLQCVLWSCILTAVYPEPPTECRENQYLLNSQCCTKCRPGEKLVNDCSALTATQCLPCSKGEFSDTWNRDRRCHEHKYCDPNLGLRVEREGNSETDTTCTCEDGRHCTSSACESCAQHTSCGPGLGVKRLGTGTSDTICEPCPDGFFSNVSSAFEKCHPWTSCETKDLVELQAGTNMTDAVCGFRNRIRALVVIPIIMGIFLFAIFLVFIYIRKVAKKPKDKALHPPETQWQDPVEMIFVEDFAGHNPAAPVQETLHGCQPVTQEDGKESRVAVQEKQ
ncbi:tumor necrosis factor receptor superfamily member 5 isoform X2 [Sciurus carolinensis]|uniref:tumor necrosis factor receptor superfamily member 5 isoform X2 n=1 Tax=Sciurus carolinensis TaxID=30640 RepID=UPI001FB50143|nr:tumor necrosis factor receptor superfamily member 5 isoform X2 [Sciurus carolinensis]